MAESKTTPASARQTPPASRRPEPASRAGTRLWAAASLVLAIVVVAMIIVLAVEGIVRGLSVLVCLFAAVGCLWYGVRRRGMVRTLALLAGGLLGVGAIVLIVVEHRVLEDLIIIAALAGTLAAARMAFRVHVAWPHVAPPSHPVLFYNPLSGGGKARRYHLADEARRRGIEAIELQRGDDLEMLVRSAVTRGADGLAMAGGDGSQAVVAMVAAELGLPYACIPAGTRNHFALDLGVDREDVVGALDAFVSGGERRVDLAEVNGRVFVNNVSLGLYADAVQRPGYREAKLHTLLDTVPDVLGPSANAPALRWQGARGEETAAAILVSNNPYRLGRALGAGTRPRLERGLLGVTVLMPAERQANGAGRRRLASEQWTDETFEVDGDGAVATGIDGEAIVLQAPLRFRTRPDALRVRIAPHHPGVSPSAVMPDEPRKMLPTLLRLVVHGGPDLAQAR